ncbi:MAG TPA: hypothetical protein DCR03_01455 [Gammaproteobacteria bacterium]|nr:hypothetical protein [Gammaproteobacteria bacterium]
MGQVSIVIFNFRYRGKTKQIISLYECFVNNAGQAMHPAQLARVTHASMIDVMRRLDATHEVFIKLPKKNGITRYRLTTSISTLSKKQVETMLMSKEKKETLFFYAFITGTLLVFVISIMAIAPSI